MINYTIDQFINYNIFLGYSKTQTLSSSYPYLLGLRKTFTLIKISKSILHCKYNYNFLSYFFSKYGGLWFVLITTYFPFKYKFLFVNLLKKCMIFFSQLKFRILFLIWKWRPGILTNYLYFRQNKKQKQQIQIHWYPNAIFEINILWNLLLQKEPFKSHIIGLNIADTNLGINNNNYILPGNEKIFISLLFYYKIFINFIIRIFLLQKTLFKF